MVERAEPNRGRTEKNARANENLIFQIKKFSPRATNFSIFSQKPTVSIPKMSDDIQRKLQNELDNFKKTQKGCYNVLLVGQPNLIEFFLRVTENYSKQTAT